MPPFALSLLSSAAALVAVLLLGTAIATEHGWLLLLDNLHWTLSFTVAAILGWMGVRTAEAGVKRTRHWFALGLSASCLGQWLWNIEEILRWRSMPDLYHYLSQMPGVSHLLDKPHDFPLSAFVSVLLGVCFIVGLFVALRERLDYRHMRAAALDLASMTLLILALVLAVYLPRSDNVGATALAILTGFPLFMLSAVCLGALTVLHLRMRPDWPWICVLAGMGMLGFLWMQWNALTLGKALTDGALINALYSPGMLLLGVGAMAWRVRTDTSPRFDRWCEGILRMLPLLVVVLAAVSILVVLIARHTLPVVRYTVVSAGVAILLLSVLRQRLLLTEYQRLLDSERRVAESQARYEYLAKYDPLTRLPNRFHLNENLGQRMEQARKQNGQLGLFLIDIDYFKNVNDSYGHMVGDALLVSIAQRLLAHKHGDDILARLGSDEFALLTSNAEDKMALAVYAHELLGALRAPFLLSNESEVFMSASIGISLFPDDATDPVQMIRNADSAMYEAKKSGRTLFHFYTFDLTAAAQERLAVGGHLHRALDAREFVLHYQPQVDHSGRIFGAEALLRWRMADGKLIPPDQFIPFAEETGLIIPIGDWVVENACLQAQNWKKLGLPEVQIAVNVSARQLRPELIDTVVSALENSQLSPSKLTIEITESAIMEREVHATSVLRALKDMGVKISIDDFGTGHSSLAKLKQLPLDELKIDKIFLRDLPSDSENAKIVSTIIAMAHSLKLEVLAEGVESPAQALFLAAHGCLQYQGYHFHRPLTADVFAERLRDDAGYERTALWKC